MPCLQENTILEFVRARLSPAAVGRVEAHARVCADCHQLIVGALHVPGLAGTAVTERFGPSPDPAEAKASALAKGTTVGRFSVLGLVGRGGMGEVYAAYDPDLDRRVALKLMHDDGVEPDARAQDRLSREAQAIAKLSHPNVVVVYEVGTFAGRVFIAMEYVEGMTLAAWLGERPRTWREVLGVFLQAARGLSAAHRAGLVHRDFKPQNVMVARDGAVRVMDFGLARHIGANVPLEESGPRSDAPGAATLRTLTRTGERVGTPLYMAPEQFALDVTDARTDQFSFCVALWWALYGAHPFGGGSAAELAKRVTRGRIAPPPAKASAPPRVQKILARGLSADAKARWASMEELAAALARDPRRWRRATSLVAAVGVVCAALGVLATRSVVRRADFCAAGPASLAAAWELDGAPGTLPPAGSHRAAVKAAILGSGVGGAPRTWERVASLLDTYATRWLGAYRDACEATHVRGEQSAEALDLRMACLNDNLDSARALTQLLARGERDVVGHAAEAAAGLEDFARCADVAQLRNGVQPPKDPLVRAKVEELRGRLKEAEALFETARFGPAIALAKDVHAAAERLQYCPLQAEALVLMGNSNYTIEGVQLLERSIDLAERCHDDRVVARAAVALVFPRGFDNRKAVQRRAEFASAAIDRIGGDKRLKSWLLNDLGVATTQYGEIEDARRLLTDAIALKIEILGDRHVDVAYSLNNLACVLDLAGDWREALAIADRAIAIGREWETEGSTFLGNHYGTRGDILLDLGRLDEAEAAYRTASKMMSGDDPFGPHWRAMLFQGLGRLELRRGNGRAALALLEKARELLHPGDDLPSSIAETDFGLAVALDLVNPSSQRAVHLARGALAFYEAAPVFFRARREVQAWLDARAPHHRRI
jgi:tetratricopeptide (TPR) repeat protein